ncbi:MAG: glycoside hydrolase family 31 protein [Lachnospiraceae bacterium]|nr:glycoside hydrolase family 31 protein [Lachnospiraceae bacterium]
MQYFSRQGQELIFRNNNETLVITPWGKDSLRVRSVMMGEVTDNRFALLEPEETEVEITIEEMKATMINGNITVVAEVPHWDRPVRLSFYNRKGELLMREIDCANAIQLRPRKYVPHLGGDYALSVAFDGQDGERFYGMGQYQEEEVDWKGCTLNLLQRNSQVSVPFVMSSRGYGMLWHNPAVGYVSFGKNRTTWHAESTKQMDYWITVGDKPTDISRNYAVATGFAPMMPEHGLGFWQCKLRYWNQQQVLEVAREYKRRNLPIDVIVIDYFHWPHMGDFRFDPEFFPDPKAMVEELKSMGIEVMVSVWPTVAMGSENYREMRQQGLMLRADYGEQITHAFTEYTIFIDATNPRTREYVWEKYKKNFYDNGIHMYWLDVAEPEISDGAFQNYRYYIGNCQQTGNIYPQYLSRLFYEGMVAEGQDNPVNLVRCAWAGSQRYGALVWSGDVHCKWVDFKRQICAGVSMGVAGIPWWTTDIGGFGGGYPEDPEFRELLVRWFQWGCYCPVMRLHGNRLPSEEVFRQDGTKMPGSGTDNEVWSFGEEAYPILVKYLERRETLRDYVRSLMKTAHEEGTPLLRGMFYEFPEDTECNALKDQYMFGDRYLVAPVMEYLARSRSVYLPAGACWRNIDTQEVFEGGQRIDVPAPLEVIPVFERIR